MTIDELIAVLEQIRRETDNLVAASQQAIIAAHALDVSLQEHDVIDDYEAVKAVMQIADKQRAALK